MSVSKVIFSLLILGVLLYAGYYEFSAPPLGAKQLIDEGISQAKAQKHLNTAEESLLRLQLALGDYIASNGSPPNSLDDLVPKYFDNVPIDPVSTQPFAYKREGMSFYLGKQVEVSAKVSPAKGAEETASASSDKEKAPQQFVNPNTMQIVDFVYDAKGKRDPFQSFDQRQQHAVDESLPPLQRYSIGQLKVTAIVSDQDGIWTAIVEDQTGRGYTAREGTKIGDANGIVASIEKDRLNIVETRIDFTGHEEKKAVIMKLEPRDDKFQTATRAKRVKHKK